MNNLEVLYEDNHIIVVYKPANVLSQGDSTGDIDMLSIVKNYIKNKYHKPGNVYIGLVHRLDRPVSGVMVFARTSKAASRLSQQIKNKEFKKKYYAIINGKIENKTDVLKDYLLKLDDGNTIVTDKEHGKESVLEYSVIKEIDGKSLVDIDLKTGRHHQIRVQFSFRGYPLVGDQRYGNIDGKQICLSSYYLSFMHPITKERIEFIRKPEKNELWELFL